MDELKQEQSKAGSISAPSWKKDVQLLMKPPSDLPKRSTGRFGKLTERTARAQAEKQLEQLRGKLTETERDCHAKLLKPMLHKSRLAAEAAGARASLAEITRAHQAQSVELQQALQAVAQHKAEVGTLRELVEQFRPTQKSFRKSVVVKHQRSSEQASGESKGDASIQEANK